MDPILYLKAVILGLVEGATEFIPVSSTGHLILAEHLLRWEDERAKTFAIFIQLGAILAVVWFYRRMLLDVALHWVGNRRDRIFLWNLLLAFLPAAVIGLAIHDYILEYLFNPITVAAALIVGGIGILLVERFRPAPTTEEATEIRPRTALGIGFAQVLALFPGVSRSGATIMGAMALRCSRVAATEFSFFLAIPVMFAATLYDLYQGRAGLHPGDAGVFAVGFIVSFVSGLLVVRWLLSYVGNHDFRGFAWYRILFGAVILAYYFGIGGF